jgi:hypothetical protein
LPVSSSGERDREGVWEQFSN